MAMSFFKSCALPSSLLFQKEGEGKKEGRKEGGGREKGRKRGGREGKTVRTEEENVDGVG